MSVAARSGRLDQAELIARELGMRFHFSPAMRVMEEEFGDAILTALPMRLVKAGALPGIRFPVRLEPRGALWTEIRLGQTHVADDDDASGAGPARAEAAGRRAERGGLARAIPTAAIRRSSPATSISCRARAPMRASPSRLQDAQRLVSVNRVTPTFPARYPRFRIDYVFVSHVDSGRPGRDRHELRRRRSRPIICRWSPICGFR